MRTNLFFLVGIFLLTGGTVTPAWAAPEPGSFFDVSEQAPRIVLWQNEKQIAEAAAKGLVVLYFAADWCPDCQANLANLKERSYRLPRDLTILLVDYDHSQELKSRYGVPIQDVFVQVDGKGKKVKLWVGGGSDEVAKRVVRS